MGLSTSLNFRIQGHKMKLVEVEGSHTLQNLYDSLDVHVGQSLSVLVTLDQAPKDYYIVASTRFSRTVLTATAVLHYSNSNSPVSGPLPSGPTIEVDWSVKQARTFRYVETMQRNDTRFLFIVINKETDLYTIDLWKVELNSKCSQA